MSKPVLDASALLALLNQEAGGGQVETVIAQGAAISAVNLAEVVAKLSDGGVPQDLIRAALGPLGLEIIAFDAELAYQAGMLRPLTRFAGLSLGDRACLALAKQLNVPALTTDRAWESLSMGITIRVAR